jgi:hypothetical protein
MEKQERGGAVRVGMIWGGIGGVVGLLVSLLGSLIGIVVAVFIGVSCGRRAAAAEQPAEQRAGAISGLIGGAIVAPVYALGSTIGALFAAREIGAARLAATLSELLGSRVLPDEAWAFFLASLVLSAVIEITLLIVAATAAGAWSKRG